MIIVTGATGRLGSQIVDRLLTRVPAASVGVSARDPQRAAGLADRGVRVRAGDFTAPGTLEHAFEGAETVLVVSASMTGQAAVDANVAAIDAAHRAGAGRVVYTSHQAASHASLFSPQLVHAATEDHLAAAGMPWTALRNGFYASTLERYAGEALASGRLALPADGPVSWTAHEDLAAAAVAALLDGTLPDGPTPPLAAPEMLDLAAVADVLAELTGRPVERVVVEDDEWRAGALAGGLPEFVADLSLGMFQASRAGEFAVTDPTLEAVIGRQATSVRSVLEAFLASDRES